MAESRSGKKPLVSSFTAKPISRIFRRKSAASGCSRGSPPERTTPSSSLVRVARKSSTSSVAWFRRLLQPGHQQGVVAEGAPEIAAAGENRGCQLAGIVHHRQFCSPQIRISFPSISHERSRYCNCKLEGPQGQVVNATDLQKRWDEPGKHWSKTGLAACTIFPPPVSKNRRFPILRQGADSL